ncbi:hypothetical protein CYCD_03610 [Tenuifilaceae bacterium CYCD]|nr:hypothetical protein CYCD_03610 [Tenuifilaceae bacterium CYCD]
MIETWLTDRMQYNDPIRTETKPTTGPAIKPTALKNKTVGDKSNEIPNN